MLFRSTERFSILARSSVHVHSIEPDGLAEINAEVDTALSDIKLDHLVAVADDDDVADDSIIGKLASTDGDWSKFSETTDSLQSIRDGQTGATGGVAKRYRVTADGSYDGTAVADCKMSQVTIGFQAGGQKYAEVIFFETSAAYERFVGNKYEFAAQVSAVALKAGASADAKYADGMLVFTQAIGGLMYEASIGGQKFKTDRKSVV